MTIEFFFASNYSSLFQYNDMGFKFFLTEQKLLISQKVKLRRK